MITRRIFLKLGGSILTDKTQPEALNTVAINRTARAIAAALATGQLQIVIGHGGGSFGHYWAARYGTHLGVHDAEGWHGVARVADAMGRLNRAVVAALLDAGVNAIGMQPSASARAAGGVLQQLDSSTIEAALAAGLVPVMFGDVVLDTQQGAAIASTEALFAFLAPRLQPQGIVLVGENGVFTADPRRDPAAQRIARIDEGNIDAVLALTGASHGTDVTGGMAAKVRDMWRLVQTVPGLRVHLIGTDPAVIERVLRGEAVNAGTVIAGG
jgi:isopentenyl phosphate kinase